MSGTKYFKPYPFFKTELTHELHAHECFLPVSRAMTAKLCEFLGEDCYTYLTLGDGCDYETLKVRLQAGHLYIDCRGEYKRSWPCGTRIEFTVTQQGLEDMINQAVPEEPEVIEEPCGYTGTMCVGIWDYHYKNGWVEKRTCSNRRLSQGYTDNPVICLDEDGCLTEIGEGSNRVAVNRCG